MSLPPLQPVSSPITRLLGRSDAMDLFCAPDGADQGVRAGGGGGEDPPSEPIDAGGAMPGATGANGVAGAGVDVAGAGLAGAVARGAGAPRAGAEAGGESLSGGGVQSDGTRR